MSDKLQFVVFSQTRSVAQTSTNLSLSDIGVNPRLISLLN